MFTTSHHATITTTITQTFVVPYLIPMLENAGAIVFTPRERDWQKNEVIVDNDQPTQDNVAYYIETSSGEKWQMADTCGFAFHAGNYYDKENPFRSGTGRNIYLLVVGSQSTSADSAFSSHSL